VTHRIPRVSVIMAVHDGQRWLADAIDSILGQTWTDLELVAVDDASTDATLSILEGFRGRDPRVRVLVNDRCLGVCAARNRGITASRGQFVTFQDQDDRSFTSRLSLQIEELFRHPEVVLVSCRVRAIDEAGLERYTTLPIESRAVLCWMNLFHNAIGCPTQVMLQRGALDAVGFFDEAFTLAEDYELWSRATAIGEVSLLPEVLAEYRIHKASQSLCRADDQTIAALRVSRESVLRHLGLSLADRELGLLHDFWTYRFPESSLQPNVSNTLRETWRHGFVSRVVRMGQDGEGLFAIRRVIARQLRSWARAVVRSEGFLSSIRLWLEALSWDPWHPLRIAKQRGDAL